MTNIEFPSAQYDSGVACGGLNPWFLPTHGMGQPHGWGRGLLLPPVGIQWVLGPPVGRGGFFSYVTDEAL